MYAGYLHISGMFNDGNWIAVLYNR